MMSVIAKQTLVEWAEVLTGRSQKIENCICCSHPLRGSRKSAMMIPECCELCARAIPWIAEPTCKVCGRGKPCHDCERFPRRHFEWNRSSVEYNSLVKGWLAMYKYRGNEKLATLLTRMMEHGFQQLQEELDAEGRRMHCFTFVPISRERELERGFNHAEQLAVALGKRTGMPVIPMLIRSRHTERQSMKSRSQRMFDVQGAFSFYFDGGKKLWNMQKAHGWEEELNVVLVDDVYTTGSTMNECAAQLKEYVKSRVYGLTLAR